MTTCLICLDEYYLKELYVTSCNHVFHKSCLLKINNIDTVKNLNDEMTFTIINCPICRNKLSIPDIFRKQYSCTVFNDNIFKNLRNLYTKLNDVNLNKEYVFITGTSAKMLYNLINSNNDTNEILVNDLYNICYVDYHDLYDTCYIKDKSIKILYNTEYCINYIKDIKYHKKTKIIYMNKNNHCGTNLYKHIRTIFDNCKIPSYKICFIIKDNYIEFFIHSDFYKI